MNRIDRLSAVLIWLQTKKYLPARDIADRFRISLRTVYRDIRSLEAAGVPIGVEQGLGYFLVEGYHLPPVMLTRREAGALVLGAKFMDKYSDPLVTAQYATALDKVKSVMGDMDQEYINRLDDQVTVLNAAGPSVGNASASILMELQPAVAESRLLRITYLSGYKEETTRRMIEPLGLCFYAGNWHLLAYCHLRRDYRDFRVSRIREMESQKVRFDRSRHADLYTLVDRMLTTIDLTPAIIVSAPRVEWLLDTQKYYYGFIREEAVDGKLEMHFLVPDLAYLAAWLLSFTDQVTVKSPPALIEMMRTMVRRLSAHYL